jgi:molybdopterin molybdotransferase
MGLPQLPAPRIKVLLASDLIANGPREHYMRAIIKDGKITDAGLQDSSLLTVLARSNALLVRPPHDPFQRKGTMMDAITLD